MTHCNVKLPKRLSGTEIKGITAYRVQRENKTTMEDIVPLGGMEGELNNKQC